MFCSPVFSLRGTLPFFHSDLKTIECNIVAVTQVNGRSSPLISKCKIFTSKISSLWSVTNVPARDLRLPLRSRGDMCPSGISRGV